MTRVVGAILLVAFPLLGAASATADASLCAMTKLGAARRPGLHPGSDAAKKDVRDVLAALSRAGLNIPIYASFEVANAAAFPNLNNSGAAVVYNPEFLSGLFAINDWAPVSVIAHEIGHHIGKSQSSPDSHLREIGADEVSGCALAWMGASREDAVAAMTRGLPVNNGSPTHPGTHVRVAAISRAYAHCHAMKQSGE